MVADAVIVSSTEAYVLVTWSASSVTPSDGSTFPPTRRGRRLTEIQFFHAVRPGSGTHH
jgi:hypothetical protein